MIYTSFVLKDMISSKLRFNIFTLIMVLIISHFSQISFGQQIKIMPLGNSITHGEHGSSPIGGFRDDLADLLLNQGVNFDLVGTQNDGTSYYPMHEGHPGQTAWYLADNIYSWLSATNPSIVLLHIGTNDINSYYSNPSIVSDIERIMNNIWSYNSNIAVLVSSVIPRNDSFNSTNTELCNLIHEMIINKLHAGKPVRYVGHNEVWITYANWQTNMLYDAFHPNNTGYNIMGETYFNLIMNQLTGVSQLITDNFNRTNIGVTWKREGPYTLLSEKLTTSSGGDYWWKPMVYIAEKDPIAVSFKWGSNVNMSADGNAGLALHLQNYTTSASGYLVYKEAETNNLKLYQLSNGSVYQLIDEITGKQDSPVTGDEFQVSMYSDFQGYHFSCFINDNYDGDLIDPNNVYGNGSGHYAGVMLAGTSNNIVDDFKLVHMEGNAEKIYAVYGDEQEGEHSTRLADSLVVLVTDSNGNPISGIPVSFDVTEGDASIDLSNSSNNHFDIEAENGTVTYPMQIMDDPAASNGQYVEVPEEYENASEAKVAFTFNVSSEADFVVWGKIKSGDGYHDSFWIQMDDGTDVKWHISNNWTWAWKQVNDNDAAEPSIFHLTAGQHTLYVKNREWGSQLDKVVITSDLGFSPNTLRKPTDQYYITNSSGRAYAFVTLGTTPGQVKVKASSQNFSDYTIFTATILTNQIPTTLAIVDGNNQVGEPSETLPTALQVQVKDAEQNVIPNLKVKFQITQGSGAMLSASEPLTNTQGIASTTLTLGSEYGNYIVQASIPGFSVTPVTFTATASDAILAITGSCIYYNNSVAINDVTITSSGTTVNTAVSGADGIYDLQNLEVGGDYVITPTRDIFDDWSSHLITTYHASLAVRYYAGLTSLTTNQRKAADVDQSNSVDAYDAALIAQFAVGLPRLEDSHVGEWVFIPAFRSFYDLSTNYAGQDFTGILLGDVTGDWNQSYNSKQMEMMPITWLEKMHVEQNESFSIPVKIDPAFDVISMQLHVQYDKNELEFISAEKSKDVSEFNLIVNDKESGNIYLGMYGAGEINAETIMNLNFRAIGSDGETSEIEIPYLLINNNKIQQGQTSIEIGSQVPTKFALHQNYPNPFNPTTTITYEIPEPGIVKMIIFNVKGQQVAHLENDMKTAGLHKIFWEGFDDNGASLPSGIYFCYLNFGNETKTIKLTKLK